MAHLYAMNPIVDTLNWTTVSGSFIADSNYKYINVGNFFDDNNTTVVYFQDTLGNNQASYYLVDDIYVSNSPLSVSRHEMSIGIKYFFPNPFDDFTTVYFNRLQMGIVNLIIYSRDGIIARSEKLNVRNGSLIIRKDNMPKGLYFVLLEIEGERINFKIVIN